jgi:hypothetical protein
MNFQRTILQAPWRTRRQRIGAILLAIVGTSMVAALYLNVASQSTLVGREIQSLERQITLAKEENADLKTELARLLSYQAVAARSENLGFHAATAEETHYIFVPGYNGKETVDLTDKTLENLTAPSLPAEYTLSLFDWLNWQMRRGSSR